MKLRHNSKPRDRKNLSAKILTLMTERYCLRIVICRQIEVSSGLGLPFPKREVNLSLAELVTQCAELGLASEIRLA